ncbi:HECT-type E3 ubiquitin transferase [Malassezia caprae]|uniref:HECT-type E3 ubiquitin transferase n=1 Tax=Malassezia caprae TaxID=1381934 RepID=A0AAF0E532_9BASI|nr:HECT-type E3 ubiquitin transferase [Malassezia caprae]
MAAPAQKRARSPEAPAFVPRTRADTQEAAVALEYQRHIHRVSVFVLTDPAQSLNTDLICRVAPAGEDSRRIELKHAQLAYLCVDVPWPLVAGEYTAPFRDGFEVMIPVEPRPTRAVFSASWLQQWRTLDALQCAGCSTKLVAFPGRAVVRALPSASWEELVDAWMCHGDQRLNISVTRGRESLGTARLPAATEVWVGSFLVKTSSTYLDAGAVHTSPAKQNNCWEHPGPVPAVLQWYPFRIVPGGCEKPCDLLGQVLSQYMLEQTERQAVHHFLLSEADGDDARPRLLLWLFQPLLDIQIPGQPLYHACKILFRVVPVAPPVPYTMLLLPHDACNEVAEALRVSSLIYPRTRRVLGEWHIGWLPRSID